MNLLRKILQIAIMAVCIVFTIYTLAWLAVTKRAEAYLSNIWSDKSLTITGNVPHFTGYPFPPETTYAGTISTPAGFNLTIPEITYFGYPVFGQLQYLEAPKGFRLSANFLDQTLNIDTAAIKFALPRNFPVAINEDSLKTWQKSGKPIVIHGLRLTSRNISALGSGTLSLDDKLQPVLDFNVRITGMDELLDNLELSEGKRGTNIARNLLNMLSKVDDVTGEKYFETTLRVQNRSVYFGPIRIFGMPEINWSGEKDLSRRRVVP